MEVSWQELIAGRIRALRQERWWTQDELAHRMYYSDWNIAWSRMVITALENPSAERHRELLAFELFALADVFGVPLVKLVAPQGADDSWILIGDKFGQVHRDRLVGLADGRRPDQIPKTRRRATPRRIEVTAEDLELVTALERFKVGTDEDTQGISAAARNAAEIRAAEDLEASPSDIAVVAYQLWGQGLTDQREQLFKQRMQSLAEEPDRNQRRVIKGHITRRLREEIRQFLEQESQSPADPHERSRK